MGLLGVSGCSGEGASDTGPAGGEQGAMAGTTGYPQLGSGGTTNAGGPGASGGAASRSCPALAAADCVGEAYAGETVPLDIYILFDQSGSMAIEVGGSTRLDQVRSALAEFLTDPRSAGVGVGIGYFGWNDILRQTSAGDPDPEPTSCDPKDYQTAAVSVGVLPDHAPAILESLSAVSPKGETPTPAALDGACSYAKQWKTQHPGNAVAILLVTDGEPKAPITAEKTDGACEPTLAQAAQAAKACSLGLPAISTYVLGVGPSLENLNQIAREGGTERAYLAADDAGSILEALNEIRNAAAIPCQFTIPAAPSGQTLDYGQVNVVFTDASCATHTVPFVDSPARCGSEHGWHYDDASSPERILLCSATCDAVTVPASQFYFTVGCGQVVR